ncbi:Uma2 family endonuclease [Paludisphaera sp.]|uniref:Uma2 family endonuclease n=1 Tax=Paludisphaera sp. TaxID=2017432 RepID=UPI00301DD449
MAVAPAARLMTADEFMKAKLGDGRFELVRGEIVELSPPYSDHGYACSRLAGLFFVYERESGYGYSLSNDTAVQTRRNPDTVRAPDVCFYSEARHPRTKLGPNLLTVAPDVAIEVVSPSNSKIELLEKVVEYLAAGSLAVWLVYPQTRSVAVFRDSRTPPAVFDDGDAIDDQPELPGFRCLVSDIFP